VEEMITQQEAKHFLEITGGLLTYFDEQQELQYEMFEPSEALASGEILSLEEKFLAGEGQNITPARYSPEQENYTEIAEQVKATLKRAAKLLGVKGYGRIDAFVRVYDDNKAETIIIEVNSLPGMTPATCIYHQAALNGYKPYDFIDKILEFGFKEKLALSTT
ncbi:MAG: D-alanine--D-alanine ligase, partial [Bacteroidota bacterium]